MKSLAFSHQFRRVRAPLETGDGFSSLLFGMEHLPVQNGWLNAQARVVVRGLGSANGPRPPRQISSLYQASRLVQDE